MTKVKKFKNIAGIVAAMMPGAKIDRRGRVTMNIKTSNETLIFNIGGEKFETFRSTLFRQAHSPLADEKFLQKHFRPDKGDYFFDRDPNIFRSTLNYLRTGELHIPSYLCGPAAKTELEFWGIRPARIERCCWTNYNDWNSTLDALNQLEKDRKGSTVQEEPGDGQEGSRLYRFHKNAATFLHNPNTSFPAEIFSFVSLFFVMLSIFSFLAETTDGFAVYKNVTVFRHQNYSDVNQNGSDVYATSSYVTENANMNTSSNDVTVKITHPVLMVLDIVCFVFFTLEYFSRVIFAVRRIKYVISVMGVIDFLAILPDVIEMIVYGVRPDLKMVYHVVSLLSAMRVIRILRIFRLIQHVPGLWILVYTLKASIGELVLLTCFMSVGILIFSSLIYFVEDREHFKSIPHAFWWALITMTTVGYGDMYPVTMMGKLIGSVCALSGLLMVGFSVPALVNNFMLYYKHVRFAIQADQELKLEKKRQTKVRLYSETEIPLDPDQAAQSQKQNNNAAPEESLPLVTVHEPPVTSTSGTELDLYIH